jgi:hypothetical protein
VGLSLTEAEANGQNFVHEFHDEPVVGDREEMCRGVAVISGDQVEDFWGSLLLSYCEFLSP